MKMPIPIFVFVLLCSYSGFSQDSIESILHTHHEEPFVEICNKIEAYFSAKHPGVAPQQLSQGVHRDGEYVKYKRWQHFWKTRLDPNGYRADLAYYHKKAQKDKIQLRTNEVLDDLEWKNISYTRDLGVQIGLGRTNALAFHPTDSLIFWVATPLGGLWKTIDGGQSYEPLGDDLPFLAVSAVVVDQENPETIYIALSDRVWYGPPSIGVYKSTDGGANWEPTSLSFKFLDDARIYWMEADPNDPRTIMTATADGLYRTEDGFATNEKVSSGSVCDVKFMPGSSEVLYYVTNNSTGFFKSTDGGKSFSFNYRVGDGYKRLLVTPLDTSKVYVCTAGDERLYLSSDAGESLSGSRNLASIEVTDGICIFSQLSDSDIYAGWFNLHHSTDEGQNFTQVSDWLGRFGLPLVHVDYRNAFCNPLQPELIYLCNDGGVYTINVTNNEFQNLSNGLQITQYYDIGVSQADAKLVSGGSQDNGNVLLFDQDWFPTAPTADGMMQGLDPFNVDMVYNGIQNGIIYRYDNAVETVISDNLPNNAGGNGEWVTPFQCDPTHQNVLVTVYDRVYLTPDNGDSWMPISDVLAEGNNLDLLEIAPSNSERIYVVENYGKSTGSLYGLGHTSSDLYVSDDGFSRWEKIDLPLPENIEDIAVDPNDADHVYLVCSGYMEAQKVFESYDAGRTWENISGSLPNLPVTAITYFEDVFDYLFIGTDDGVYYTRTEIIDWNPVGDFPNTYISEIEIQKEAKLIRVGTHGRGIFEGELELNDVSNIDLELTDCIEVYPNPVATQLYLSDKDPETTIEILNVKGQVLLTSTKNKLDLSSFSAGNYYLKSSTEGRAPCLMKVIKI